MLRSKFKICIVAAVLCFLVSLESLLSVFADSRVFTQNSGVSDSYTYSKKSGGTMVVDCPDVFLPVYTVNGESLGTNLVNPEHIFEKDGIFYFSEVNPRFGGGYPHAYACGADHMTLIKNNLFGKINERKIGDYAINKVMMKYNEIMLIDTVSE